AAYRPAAPRVGPTRPRRPPPAAPPRGAGGGGAPPPARAPPPAPAAAAGGPPPPAPPAPRSVRRRAPLAAHVAIVQRQVPVVNLQRQDGQRGDHQPPARRGVVLADRRPAADDILAAAGHLLRVQQDP